MGLALIREGRELADEALAKILPFALIAKAGGVPPDPLTPSGFDQVVLALIGKLRRIVAGPEKKALNGLLDALDVSWGTMTAAQRSASIAAAGKTYLGLAEAAAPAVGQLLLGAGKTIALDTKHASNEHHDLRIDAHLSAIDQTVLEASAQHTALYVRDQYGRRREAISGQARAIVADGLDKGYDRNEIAKMLRAQIAEADFKRSDAYFRMIADVFASRARNYASLSSYADAGIDAYEIVAVNDEVTTDLCRYLDGKVFSTHAALDRYARVADSEDPEVVTELQPWGSTRKDADGNAGLYIGKGEGAQRIASIQTSGIGTQVAGSYAADVDDGELQARGLISPPFHAHCRTTTVPTERAAPTIQVPAKAPVDEPAPLRPEEPARVVTEAESAAIEREVEPTWKPIKPKGGYLNLRAPDFKDQDGKKKKIKDPDLEARLANIFTTGSYAYEGVEPDALTVEFGPIHSKVVDKSRPYLDHLERMLSAGDLTAHTRDYDLNYRGDQYRLTWPSDKFDKGRVASFMVGPAKDGKPITAIKYDGKIYIHSGADKLAAALIKRETTLDVNLVDIDAWRATSAGAKSVTAAEANNTIRLLNSLPAASTGEGVDTSAFGFTAHVKPTYTGDLASTLRRLGAADVEELADRHGAVTPLDFGRDLKHVVGPRTLNRGAVARTIGAGLPSPIVIKQGERAWIHSGAESLAVARLGSPKSAQVRVIDLDKLGPTTAVDPGEWARRLAPDLDAVKNGAATPEQQRAVREGFRSLIAAEGMTTRDDLRGTSRFTRNPVMNVLVAEPTHAVDVAASHSWVGRVVVGPRYALEAAVSAAKIAADPAALKNITAADGNANFFGFSALIHEEIHGASSIAATAYARDGVGVGIEEALTELLARRVTRKTLGITAPAGSYDTPFGLPSRMRPTSNLYNTNADHGAYNDFIRGLFNQVGEHTGHDDIHDRVERAALKTRAWNGGKSEWQTGEEQVRAFVDALDVEQPEQREALYAALIGPSSPLRP